MEAMNTSHERSLATVHDNTDDDSMSRLETIATMSDVEVPFAALRDQVNSAVDIIVQLTRAADGTRRITEVRQVVSRRREDFRLAPLMLWDDMAQTPSFVRFQLPGSLVDRLRSRGEHVPSEFLDAPPAPEV